MNIENDTQAVQRIRSIARSSTLDTVSAAMISQASTVEDMRAIIRQRLPACPLKTALLAACGVSEALSENM